MRVDVGVAVTRESASASRSCRRPAGRGRRRCRGGRPAAGSSPYERVLMTGLRGLLLTSTTGAKLTWTPIARDSTAVIRPGLVGELLVAGGAERHVARKRRRAFEAEPGAGLEVGGVEQRIRRDRLQAVEQRRRRERLAERHGAVVRVEQHVRAPARSRRTRGSRRSCTRGSTSPARRTRASRCSCTRTGTTRPAAARPCRRASSSSAWPRPSARRQRPASGVRQLPAWALSATTHGHSVRRPETISADRDCRMRADRSRESSRLKAEARSWSRSRGPRARRPTPIRDLRPSDPPYNRPVGVEEHRKTAVTGVRCAVLTISDTRAPETDVSGRTIVELLEAAGHVVAKRRSCATSRRTCTRRCSGRSAASTRSSRPAAPASRRATAPTKRSRACSRSGSTASASSSARSATQEIGSAAMLSRACAGVARGTAIFILPGSENAVRLGDDEADPARARTRRPGAAAMTTDHAADPGHHFARRGAGADPRRRDADRADRADRRCARPRGRVIADAAGRVDGRAAVRSRRDGRLRRARRGHVRRRHATTRRSCAAIEKVYTGQVADARRSAPASASRSRPARRCRRAPTPS